MWGFAAWDNDSAADWFGDMFDATALARYVEQTLNRDVQECPDEIRAAAYVMVALGRVYIWPIKDPDRHLKLAVSKLEEVKKVSEYQDSPELVKAIDDEIAILKSRLPPPTR
jgi:hypothetical protein